jgi:hypothetical protein
MPATGEQIFAKCLKAVLLMGTGYFLFALGSLMVTMSCTSTGPSGAFMWSWLLSLPLVGLYSRVDLLSKGLFKANVTYVRIAAACLLSIEVAVAAHLGAQLSACQGMNERTIVPPAAFLMLYTAIALSLLFGDGWLGVIRHVLRRGRRPFDFLNPDGPKPDAIQPRTARRKTKRRR